MLCFSQKMRNHRYTYENNLRWRKTFWNIKLGAKVWNSSILQWTSIFQYDIGKFYRKNPIFLANRPPIGLKDAESSWKTTKIHPFSNIYFRCRDILILVFLLGLKARPVIFKFLLLIKYSETFFGILKLFSYVYRSFCIRFFIRNVFLWNLKF